ncbi:hypothetical protein HZS_3586 [Henneguya salminicola]|nr:hypothetical protein HZS_3586 [Henneguya salminicola]
MKTLYIKLIWPEYTRKVFLLLLEQQFTGNLLNHQIKQTIRRKWRFIDLNNILFVIFNPACCLEEGNPLKCTGPNSRKGYFGSRRVLIANGFNSYSFTDTTFHFVSHPFPQFLIVIIHDLGTNELASCVYTPTMSQYITVNLGNRFHTQMPLKNKYCSFVYKIILDHRKIYRDTEHQPKSAKINVAARIAIYNVISTDTLASLCVLLYTLPDKLKIA